MNWHDIAANEIYIGGTLETVEDGHRYRGTIAGITTDSQGVRIKSTGIETEVAGYWVPFKQEGSVFSNHQF